MDDVLNSYTNSNNLGRHIFRISSTELDRLEAYEGLRMIEIAVGEDAFRPAISRGWLPWRYHLTFHHLNDLPITKYISSSSSTLRDVTLRTQECHRAQDASEHSLWKVNVEALQEWIQFRLDLRRGIRRAHGIVEDDEEPYHATEPDEVENDRFFYAKTQDRYGARLDSAFGNQNADKSHYEFCPESSEAILESPLSDDGDIFVESLGSRRRQSEGPPAARPSLADAVAAMEVPALPFSSRPLAAQQPIREEDSPASDVASAGSPVSPLILDDDDESASASDETDQVEDLETETVRRYTRDDGEVYGIGRGRELVNEMAVREPASAWSDLMYFAEKFWNGAETGDDGLDSEDDLY